MCAFTTPEGREPPIEWPNQCESPQCPVTEAEVRVRENGQPRGAGALVAAAGGSVLTHLGQ